MLENKYLLIRVPSGKTIFHGESPISEVKQLRATSVLGWVTACGEAVQLRGWANSFFFFFTSVIGWVTAWEHGVPLRTAPSVVSLTNYPAHIPFACC